MKDPFEHVAIEIRQIAAGLVGLVVAGVLLTLVNPVLAGTVAVLFFFFVVMIGLHELGHFVMAKRAGMKVTEFFIGFGPRLWSMRRGETEYGIKALPLGGYCKIVGMTNLEDIDPVDEPRTYRAKGWWAKVSTVVAGPVTHFVLAIGFVYAILLGGGDLREAKATLTIDEVTERIPVDVAADDPELVPSGAAAAGLRAGDTIVSVDGEPVETWAEVSKQWRDRPGAEVALVVERAGERVDIAMTIMAVYGDKTGRRVQIEPFEGGEPRGFAGLAPEADIPAVGVGEALYLAPIRTYQGAVETVGAIGHIFSPAGISEYLGNFSSDESEQSDTRFISPVGFGRVAGDAVRAGWVEVFALLASINLFVGLLNLLPLLPFDGGHIAVASYESIASRIRRRAVRVDFARLLPVMVATLSVLAFIFVSALFLDISRPPDAGF